MAAPILLTLIRLLQGVSVGGEFIGSILFSAETAPSDQRGLYGSLSMASAVMGTVVGNMVSAVIRSVWSEEDVLAFAWRLPFLGGCLVAFVALWIRCACGRGQGRGRKGKRRGEEKGRRGREWESECLLSLVML